MPHNPEVDASLVPVPDDGYVYQTRWQLATSDIDEHRRLRLDGVARYIQEVGAQHLADAGLAEVHPHWIVLRTVIDVLEPIEIPSEITFRRWCAGLSSRWCDMRVQLVGDQGGRIETQGFWICMNKDTLTPSRLTDYCIERFGSTTDNHRLKWRPWVTEHVQAATDTPFPLRRTDIDLFEHVNNTIYWHGVHEILAHYPELENNPYRAVLEYRSPIKYGEELTIRSEHSGDAVRMDFTVGEDVRAAALVRKI
ncbi:acyl-[acyl-carrier-protein] thioesterase [Mycobacterium sp. TY815]|uniref:acyl-[acyl-carrier-protein] thioesterase n=1 Tax=Mycobacterium sp. TY815 TaxID=3050581 RepID=UPI0027419C8D|nr:acyl-[acyl-carrier-protein] thioesterase [Mycobacterium sp. TY815]MDP7701664.1 acyl-[acyl-carrier-protein] thioesterase [Mycobacterium sp. TY815]